MLALSWADVVAGVHLAVVLFMLTGALLSWRWPRLLWAHFPLTSAILALSLAQAGCPLTELEMHLRRWNGEAPYSGGFISHYLVEPVHPQGITERIQVAIYVVGIAPNALGYAVLCLRRRPTTGTRPPGQTTSSASSATMSTRAPLR